MVETEHIDVDVLVVGAGIAGAAFACALRNSGLSVLLIEKSAAPLDTARGDHLQPSTLAILDRWGVLDRLIDAGGERRLGSVWYSAEGETLLHSSLAELDVPHPYYLYLNHESIGSTLLQAALEDSQVNIERPIRNWWPEDRSDSTADVRVGRVDGTEVRVSARLIVGADGRSSRVRKLFGFTAGSYRYERPIAVMFARPARRSAANDLEVYLSERQMVAVIPRTGGGCKIGVPVHSSEVAQWRQADGAELKLLLKTLVPPLDVDDVCFADVYPPVYLRADSWINGNAVLIGDACHAMHPARSQGMNTAIRCIDVLAAKLRDSVATPDGQAFHRLLADYETALKPTIDVMLEKNHQHGLEMDRSGAESYAATCASLKSVQRNPAIRTAFAMNAAGYAGVVN